MRLLLSWVRDFVDVTAPPVEVAARLALRGFEVAAIERADPAGPAGPDEPGGDAVIDFEVTANRPDCLGVLGFAREISAIYDLPLRSEPVTRPDAVEASSADAAGRIAVSIEDAELCPRYAAVVAEVTGGTSPAWMTRRLKAVGLRPISPIVDVTNYVLVERGHPLHAFDLATLAGSEIRVRRARANERLTTLDGQERRLDADMLVIADRDRAQAVAGVMGGAASEVSGRTRTVLFESAYFKPASVRRTSKRLGLKTEASSRFERGADVNAPVAALERAVALMEQIGAGRRVGPIVDRYPAPVEGRIIALRRARLAMLLGMSVPDLEVARILERLGLTVAPSSDGWTARVPSFRVDLAREVDLIEEVGRHHGFDKVTPAFPAMGAPAPPPDARITRDRQLRAVLSAAGLSEAVSFGVVGAAAARTFAPGGDEADLVGVANPLSAKFDTLRPSLLPGLIDAVAHNRRHGRLDVGLFEIGARFTASGGEERAVAVAWTGSPVSLHWSGGSRAVDFFDVKGAVDRVCGSLGVVAWLEPAAVPFLVDGQAAHVMAPATDPTLSARGTPIGVVGLLAPAAAEGQGAPKGDQIFVAELSLDRLPLAAGAEYRVAALPRQPQVVRDISIVVADTLPAAIIRGTIQTAAGPGAHLAAVTFFDRYIGSGIPAGTVSLSVRLTFQAPDRTLTDGEVQQRVDAIVSALVGAHGASQR